MQVYLVVFVKNPTPKQKHDEGAVPTIVAELKAVLAKDEAQAVLKASRFLPEEWAGKEEQLDARVLSFRSVAVAV